MRSLNLLAIALFIMFSQIVNSQVHGNIESQNLLVSGGTTTPQVNIYLRESVSQASCLSWTGWALISKGWSEAYVGLIYSPVSFAEVSLSYGLESNDDPARIGWSVWLGSCGLSSFSAFEQGGSGFWFKHILKYRYDSFAAGIHYQRFKGYGPYIECLFLSKFVLWGSYLMGETKDNSYVGLKLTF